MTIFWQAFIACWLSLGTCWLIWAGPKAYQNAKKANKVHYFFALAPLAILLWPFDAGISLLAYLLTRSKPPLKAI